MKFTETETWGFKHAIRGARNPMNSWDRSDSIFTEKTKYGVYELPPEEIIIGKNDLALLQKLIKAGPEHRKFMRQIIVSVDITAPLYWWKEFDTYKIGTTANSTSTMHKLATTPITIDCFEIDDLDDSIPLVGAAACLIEDLEICRKKYLETKDKRYWKELIRWLPESWLQTRTVTMNYENLYSIVRQRKGHRLTEWNQFINWAKTLPFAKELIFLDY